MNTLQLPPEKQTQLSRYANLARNIAMVAGIFSAIVCIILAWSFWQFRAADPINSPYLPQLIEQLQQGNTDPGLADSVRNYDQLIRRAHFSALAFIHFGKHLLLGGIILLLLSLKIWYECKRRLPLPEPYTPLQEQPEKIRMLQTAILVSALLCILLAFLLPRWLSTPLAIQTESSGHGITTPLPDEEQLQKNWPSFRGYRSLGLGYEQTPPTQWDLASEQNIRWKSVIPKPGFNSPIIWENRIFLSGADEQAREIYCYDLNTGALLWQKSTTVTKPVAMPKVTEDTGFAAPSLATDGRVVAGIFATGEIMVLSLDGNRVWEKKLSLPANHYGHASSLLIHADTLFIQYDSDQNARILALHILTGKKVWEKKRSVDISWSSPIIIPSSIGDQLILTATPMIIAYNPANGDVLWQMENVVDGEIGPSPAFENDRLFFINQYSTLACVDMQQQKVLWNYDRNLSDIPSLVAKNNLLIVPTSFGKVSCLDTADGKLLWEERFENGFNASPIIIQDRVYLLDITGIMHIFKLSPTYTPIASPSISEACVATPAFKDQTIVIRGKQHLFGIGKEMP